MNMKTNVIFKNGVNLVCERVNKLSSLTFLNFEKVCPSKASELMNECLKNGWDFNTLCENELRISVPTECVERFEALLF